MERQLSTTHSILRIPADGTLLALWSRGAGAEDSWVGGWLGDEQLGRPARAPELCLSPEQLHIALSQASALNIGEASELGPTSAHSPIHLRVGRDTHATWIALWLSTGETTIQSNLRDQLEKAQEVANIGSWVLDVASGGVTWTPQLFRMFALPVADQPPQYQVHHTLFTPESWAKLEPAVALATSEGVPYNVVLEYVRSTGERRFGRARGLPTTDASGAVTHLTGTFQDITAEQQRQRELEDLSHRLSLATDAAQHGVWDWSLDSGDLVWDARMHELYEHDGEPSFDVWRNSLHPEDVERTLAVLERCLDEGEDFAATFRIQVPSGVRWVRSLARRSESMEDTRLIGVNLDMTREHGLLQRLQRSREVLQELVTQAPAAIAMCDREMRYLAVSNRWRVDFGLQHQKLIGLSHYDAFPNLPASWRTRYLRTLEGGVDIADEVAYPQPDGSTRWLTWEVRPWKDEEDQIGGVILFMRDITAQRRMTFDLSRQTKELERSNRALEEFAYAVSHDLREPLRGMAGCASLLESAYRGQLDPTADDLIEHIQGAAERMRQLIDDLLAYSRVGSASMMQVDLARSVNEALTLLDRTVSDSQAKIEVGDLPTVLGEPTQLSALFQNLVSNALKYRGTEPPEILISAESQPDMLRVFVQDNGIGIEPQYREQVFDLFHRLHGRDEYSGTGIGLALCRRIVEQHGGSIQVVDSQGPGTRICFSLPRAE